MAEDYEPPQGTNTFGTVGAVLTVLGVGLFIGGFFDNVLIPIAVMSLVIGVAFLLIYRDIKSPNGKYTLKRCGPKKYELVKRGSSSRIESSYEDMVKERQLNPDKSNTKLPTEQEVFRSLERKLNKKKKNDTGVFTYMNCPHCGSLNESGSDVCRSCGKKL